MRRLYWLSLLRTSLVYGLIVAVLVLLALALGVYLPAAILLLLLFLYRGEILDPGGRGRRPSAGGDLSTTDTAG